MNLFNKWFNKPKPQTVSSPKIVEPETKKPTIKKKTPKEIATEAGEPYVAVISFELDPENLHQGAFELDWNDKFVTNLIRAGYQQKPDEPDSIIVDRWFQNICRHVVLETWEQEQAINPQRFTKTRNLGDGYTEIS
jgi:hypothetical protein